MEKNGNNLMKIVQSFKLGYNNRTQNQYRYCLFVTFDKCDDENRRVETKSYRLFKTIIVTANHYDGRTYIQSMNSVLCMTMISQKDLEGYHMISKKSSAFKRVMAFTKPIRTRLTRWVKNIFAKRDLISRHDLPTLSGQLFLDKMFFTNSIKRGIVRENLITHISDKLLYEASIFLAKTLLFHVKRRWMIDQHYPIANTFQTFPQYAGIVKYQDLINFNPMQFNIQSQLLLVK